MRIRSWGRPITFYFHNFVLGAEESNYHDMALPLEDADCGKNVASGGKLELLESYSNLIISKIELHDDLQINWVITENGDFFK